MAVSEKDKELTNSRMSLAEKNKFDSTWIFPSRPISRATSKVAGYILQLKSCKPKYKLKY